MVRQPAASLKSSKKTKKANPEPRTAIWRYIPEFQDKYGENGRPSNVFLNYHPPSARERLRDSEGKELRANAEKSILINEFLVELFTPQEGVVYDMFAGYCSFGCSMHPTSPLLCGHREGGGCLHVSETKNR